MKREDKLAAVERLIVDFRWARSAGPSSPSALEQQTYQALKEIAAELRVTPETTSAALYELQRRVDAVVASTSRSLFGPEGRRQTSLVNEVVSRWPTIRAALEQLQTAEEETRG